MSSRVEGYDLMLWFVEDPVSNIIEGELDGDESCCPPRHHHEAMKMFADDSSISVEFLSNCIGAGVSTTMPNWNIGNTYKLIKDGKEIFVSHGVRDD